MTPSPVPTTVTDPYEGRCTNTYGPESGPHRGPSGAPLYVAQLYVGRGKNRRKSSTIGPVCPAHATYEQTWRAAIGAIATAEVEPYEPTSAVASA